MQTVIQKIPENLQEFEILAAMGIHFAVDALGALLKDAVPVPVLEAILAAIVIVTAIFTVRLYRGETEKAVSD